MSDEKLKEILNTVSELPVCVISKETYGEYRMHDIQTNNGWAKNPYKNYAVVPKNMVEDIVATRGFCDIELNEDSSEVVAFTAREIPVLPTEEQTATQLDRIEAQVTYTAMMTDTLIM